MDLAAGWWGGAGWDCEVGFWDSCQYIQRGKAWHIWPELQPAETQVQPGIQKSPVAANTSRAPRRWEMVPSPFANKSPPRS